MAGGIAFGKTFCLVASTVIFNLLTKTIVMGLPQSILWGYANEEWVNMVQNDMPRIIGGEWKWYPLQPLNSVPHRHLEIHTTPLQGFPPGRLALEPIVVVTTPGVAEILNIIMTDMIYGTELKLLNLLQVQNSIFTHKDLKMSTGKPEN